MSSKDKKRKDSTSGKPSDNKTRSELSNAGGPKTSVPAAGPSTSESKTRTEQTPTDERGAEDNRNSKDDKLLNFNKSCGHLPPPYLFSPRYQSEEETPAGPSNWAWLMVPFTDKETAEAAELWFLRQRGFASASIAEAAASTPNKGIDRSRELSASLQFDEESLEWVWQH
jgi:hypothetical protein